MDQIGRLRSALEGRYTLEREIGRGGMSIVYRARDVRLDRDVAVKVLRPELTVALGADRFLREIQIAARLQHPHILPLHESGEADGLFYYVMPFVAGESLRSRLLNGPLSVPEAVRIAGEIGGALTYAHEQGFIHRDVKPENILLSSGLAMIADFGIAQALVHAGLAPLTDSGVVVGTPGYMSPEQSAGHTKLDARTDEYSLACVVYEMLAGEPPFTGPTAQAILARHIHERPPSLRVIRPTVPVGIEESINRALAKVPADRFASAMEFSVALSSADQTESPVRRRSRFLWPALGGVVIAIGVWSARDRLWPADRATVSAGLDPTRMAVLYFTDRSEGGTLRPVAHGLTEDLIDALSGVQGLHIVSPSGVRPYSEKDLPVDSIARVLHVGTLVEGSVEQSVGGLRVRVRLVDAATGQQLQSAIIERPRGDLFALQAALADSISRFLRRELGREVRLREQRASTNSVVAWELVRQAAGLTEDATALVNASRAPAAAMRLLLRADTLLARAQQLDGHWIEPLIARGWVSEQISEISGSNEQVRWLTRGVQFADDALQITPGDPRALELRGTLRYWIWQARGGDPAHLESLMDSVEQDLRTAVTSNPGLARSWNRLSDVYQLRGDWTQADITLRRAIEADAYLTETAHSVQALFFASLERGDSAAARRWCRVGRSQFPDEYYLWECDLTLLGWLSSDTADVSRAWKLVRWIEARDTANLMAMGWGVRRMLVAAILGRSGMGDSARQVIKTTRARASPAVLQTFDLYDAYVQTELGDHQRAIRALRAHLQLFPQLRDYVAHARWFIPLHADTAFQKLVGG
jgi:serine/threonine-protein kinase